MNGFIHNNASSSTAGLPISIAQQRRLVMVTVLAFVALVLWDLTPLDIALAQALSGPGGFPLRNHWALTRVLHEGGRLIAWLLASALVLGIAWPFGVLRRLGMEARIQLAVTTVVASFCISALKWFSLTSCPWDLSAFGGWARYASHWSAVADGGSGHCFPAGHASAGFAFIGGFFVFRYHSPRIARLWLLCAVGGGLVLGFAQQARGAHFMSHTLWTAFICWVMALTLDRIWAARRRGKQIA